MSGRLFRRADRGSTHPGPVKDHPVVVYLGAVVAGFIAGWGAHFALVSTVDQVISKTRYATLLSIEGAMSHASDVQDSLKRDISMCRSRISAISDTITSLRTDVASKGIREKVIRMDLEIERRVRNFILQIEGVQVDETWSLAGFQAYLNAVAEFIAAPHNESSPDALFPEFSSLGLKSLLAEREQLSSPAEHGSILARVRIIPDLQQRVAALSPTLTHTEVRVIRNRFLSELKSAFKI